jgi:hypothetical protein
MRDIYSIEQFEKDISNMKPRIFDTYILPAFLILYSLRSKEMRVNARRILFTSGVYMGMRNYTHYKNLTKNLMEKIQNVKSG